MYLAASQRYQPNKPGYCPSYLPYTLYQIPRCMSASAGRVSILKFHSDRNDREKGGCGGGGKGKRRVGRRELRSKRFIRIAGLFVPSSDDDRTFPPCRRSSLPLILDDFVRGLLDMRSIVRFNGLFLPSSVANRYIGIYVRADGRLEKSIVCAGGYLAKFYGKFKYSNCVLVWTAWI